MKIIKVFFLLISFVVHAQENLNTSLNYLNGLPDDVRSQILNASTSTSPASEAIEIEDNLETTKLEDTIESENQSSPIFGFDFFLSNNDTNAPVLDIPLQSDYILSFDDQIEILITGNNSRLLKTRVDLSGNILVQGIGVLSVLNLPISVAQQKLQALVDKNYLGSEVYLSVTRASLKKISVIGAVKAPGTYLLNPFVSLSETLKYSGGLEDTASLREIIIKSLSGEEKKVDLYQFLIFGDRSSDLNLKNGDSVIVPATTKRIEMTGNVNRPMIYEYLPTDTYKDLVTFSQGFGSASSYESLFISASSEGTIKPVNFNIEDRIGNKDLRKAFIGKNTEITDNEAYVSGSAVSSGVYAFNKGQSLKILVDKLSFSSNIYPFFAVVKSTNINGLETKYETFSLADPVSYEFIEIYDNPEIFFFSREEIDLFSELTLIFGSEVKDLSNIDKLKERLKEQEYFFLTQLENRTLNSSTSEEISLVGLDEYDEINKLKEKIAVLEKVDENFSYVDLDNKIRNSNRKIINIGKNTIIFPFQGKVSPASIFSFLENNIDLDEELVSVNLKSNLEQNAFYKFFDSKDLDIINFPEKTKDTFIVEINGLVNNPGKYIINSNTSLNDLYLMAGGLTNNASAKGIIVSRSSVKERERLAVEGSKKVLTDVIIAQVGNPLNSSGNFVDIQGILSLTENLDYAGRVSGNFAPFSASAKTFYLEEGDEILVPARSSTITVAGEVLNPLTTMIIENQSWDEYINYAGGFTNYADKKAAYVIKANGESYVLSSGYFKKELFPESGDTLVVPRDLSKLDTIPLVSVATKIISDVAFAAASLNSIRN
tara:strand:+ start:25085 stop:27568 length:2484 start_codon:yes stop_codon:yes gene_type:complete